jgi:hypothetical protein
MVSILGQQPGAILDNYADVLEGGSSWRGSGTAYYGIPGRYSNDPDIRSGADSPLTASAASADTTHVTVASTYSWDQSRWVKSETPGFWLLCTSGTVADEARKISAWDNTTKKFTVASAFSAIPAKDDVFAVLQGFRRIPNGIDIEGDDGGIPHGFDRFFHLRTTAGEQMEWHGSGVATFRAVLELRFRLLTYGRIHDAEAAAFENMAIIRSALCRGTHRDGTYTRGLIPYDGQSEIVARDSKKIVIRDRYTLIYRVTADYR